MNPSVYEKNGGKLSSKCLSLPFTKLNVRVMNVFFFFLGNEIGEVDATRLGFVKGDEGKGSDSSPRTAN